MGKVADKLPLHPAVALAERMQRVDFPEIMRRAFAESGGVKSGKVLFLGKLLKDRCGGALYVRMVGEQVAALADVYRPQLSCPFLYVAEQVTVNRLQMLKVKAPFRWLFGKFPGPLRRKIRFGCFKECLVGDAQTIFQDTGCRVNVVVIAGVFGHGSNGHGCCG